MTPFTQIRRDQVGSLGEAGLITHIRRWLGTACPPAPQGIGDDCAVLPPIPRGTLVTVDPVIFGRHFDDSADPADVGQKLINRNLSDIAAMGGTPLHAVVSLALPADVSIRWIQSFHRGLAKAALRSETRIVGGDVAQSPTLSATLTLIGAQAGRRVLTREGARAGDWILVTGALGGSLRGRHLRFAPRLAEGRWLAGRREVRAMMDVSDGIAKDLRSLCPPECLPAIDPESLPIHRDARLLARESGSTALLHALTDGEDYELLIAVDAKTKPRTLIAAWNRVFKTQLHCIGRFVPGREVPAGLINPTTEEGYAHFGRA